MGVPSVGLSALPSTATNTETRTLEALEGSGFRAPRVSCASYFAFLFSISMRTLAAGPDEAGF
jgi:hypothetical protein